MKAASFSKYGPPEVFEIVDIEKPAPKDDEVLIKVRAATVTPAECEMRAFKVPLWYWLPLRLYLGVFRPRVKILGQEYAGAIEAVGNKVSKFKVGDEVFAMTGAGFGSYVEYKCQKDSFAMAIKPSNMNFEEAATLATGGSNALHFMRLAKIGPGDKVLINGGGGNIGTFAVQIAKAFGAEVTVVDSGDKLAKLRKIGADHVIDYTKEDFAENVGVYDAVLDVVCKGTFSRALRALKKGGRYLMADPRVGLMLRGFVTSRLSSMKVIWKFAGNDSADLVYLKEMVEAGKLTAVVDKAFPMEQMAEAHRHVESAERVGQVAITVS